MKKLMNPNQNKSEREIKNNNNDNDNDHNQQKENLNLSNDINIENYIISNDEDLNDLNYIWKCFKNKPSKISIHSSFDGDQFWSLLEEQITIDNDKKYTSFRIITTDKQNLYDYKYLIKISDDIYLSLYEYIDDNNHNINDIIFYYNNRNVTIENINEFISIINPSQIIENKDTKLSCLVFEDGKLGLNFISNDIEYKIPKDGDFFDNYDTSIIRDMTRIIDKIDNEKNEIYTIYGEMGNGKTSYIGYLIDKINKDIIIVPYNIVESFFTSPELVTILKNYPDKLFIIDDAEGIFMKNSDYLNGVVQIVKGVLSSYVSVKFLFSFNKKNDNIIPNSILSNSEIIINFGDNKSSYF